MTKEEEPKDSGRAVIVDEHRAEPPGRPRVLLTNDDGIASPGLRCLARRLATHHDLVVVAPDEDWSGSGTAIGRFDPEKGVAMRSADFDGVEAYMVAGPPGLAVTSAALGAFGPPPEIVVSGVNLGMNTGHSVIHSGTVGAVLTARTFGSCGVAMSLARSDPWQWETAVEVADGVIDWLIAQHRRTLVLNVNVPAVPLGQIRGTAWAHLDQFGHIRVATTDEPGERVQFEVAGSDSGRHPESDTALCRAGWVTLTPLSAVEAESFPAVAPETLWGRATAAPE